MTRKLLYICLVSFCNTLGSCGCHHIHEHKEAAKHVPTEKQNISKHE